MSISPSHLISPLPPPNFSSRPTSYQNVPISMGENARPSTSDMTSGNRSDEGATTESHDKGEKSKHGAAWKQNEVHEVPHK